MNRRTESYWEKRSISRISAAEKRSIPYIKQVQRVYRKAAKDTIESVRAMYRAYYKNDKTFDMDALNGIAPQGDVKRFLAQMKAKGLSTYLPDNYKGRMTRLELINAQIWGEVKKASVSEKIATTELYEKVFENSYYQTGFDMAKGLGENIAFSTLDKATVEKVLSQKFEGEDFSNRIWNNTDRLANQLTEIMAKAIATGASVERTSREFRERFGVGISNATRLVRTETCYFENSAELAAYAEMGIEEFVFVATLDSRTSDICQSMDGQKFKMSKAMVGENVPPLHPNCRSTIVAYLGKEYEPETRAYRDPETGRNKTFPKNITYAEWKKQFLDAQLFDSGVTYSKSLFSDGVDDALVRKSVKQAERILDGYPKLQKSLERKGGILIKRSAATRYKGATRCDNSQILLSEHAYSSTKAYRKTLAKEIAAGKKMRVPERYYDYYTITHEMGHVVENYLLGKKSADYTAANEIRNDIIRIAERLTNKRKNELLKEMSEYGRSKPQEFFAEAFVSYKLGGKNIWSRAMREYLKGKDL